MDVCFTMEVSLPKSPLHLVNLFTQGKEHVRSLPPGPGLSNGCLLLWKCLSQKVLFIRRICSLKEELESEHTRSLHSGPGLSAPRLLGICDLKCFLYPLLPCFHN